jgi:hypothetical protein
LPEVWVSVMLQISATQFPFTVPSFTEFWPFASCKTPEAVFMAPQSPVGGRSTV